MMGGYELRGVMMGGYGWRDGYDGEGKGGGRDMMGWKLMEGGL